MDRRDATIEQLEHFMNEEKKEIGIQETNQIEVLKKFEQIYFSIGSSKLNINHRIKIIKDFYLFLKEKNYSLSSYKFDLKKFWINIKDIFNENENNNEELINITCELITLYLNGIHENENIFDQEITTIIEIYLKILQNQRIDGNLKINFLKMITNNGKNISNFNSDLLIEFILKLIIELKDNNEEEEMITISNLNFLNSILRFSFNDLNFSIINKIIDQILILFKKKRLLKYLLIIYETIIEFGNIPSQNIKSFCFLFCQTINIKELSEETTLIMNKMLKSTYGQRTFQLLLDILNYSDSLQLYRGATYFLGQTMWGSKYSIEKIKKNNNRSLVLNSFLKVMTHQNELVSYEILLILNQLISSNDLIHSYEWDLIIQILIKISTLNFFSKFEVSKEINLILVSIINLFKEEKYFGEEDDFFKLMKIYKNFLNEEEIYFLISLNFEKQKIHPSINDWKIKLKDEIFNYFLNEKREKVKINLIENLQLFFFKFKNIYSDEILDEILPIFEFSNLDSSKNILNISINFLVKIMKELSTLKKFNQLVYLLDKFIQQDLFKNISLFSLKQMIEIFKIKFISLPCSESNIIFITLIKTLEHKSNEIKLEILNYFLTLKSDKKYKLQLNGIVSPYLKCHSTDLVRTISWVLPVSLFIDQLIDQMSIENDYQIFNLMLIGLKDIFINLYILKDTPISKIIYLLCNILTKRSSFIFEKSKLMSEPNCCLSFIEILNIIIGLKFYLNDVQRENIITSFLFILFKLEKLGNEEEYIIKLMRRCIEGLNICISELKKEVNSSLETILSFFSRLEYEKHKSIIFPIFSFLHNLGLSLKNDCSIYSETVFSICLKFLNENYPNDILSIVNRVICVWFIKINSSSRELIMKEYLPILYTLLEKSTIVETTIDFMIKYTYMEIEQNILIKNYVNKLFTGNPYKAWTLGNGILTAQSGRFGFVLLRFRRATGTIVWTMRLLNSIKEKDSNELTNSNFSSSNNSTNDLINNLKNTSSPSSIFSNTTFEINKEDVINSNIEMKSLRSSSITSVEDLNELKQKYQSSIENNDEDDTRLYLTLNSLNELIGEIQIEKFDPLPSYESNKMDVQKIESNKIEDQKINKKKFDFKSMLSPRSQPEIRLNLQKESFTPFPTNLTSPRNNSDEFEKKDEIDQSPQIQNSIPLNDDNIYSFPSTPPPPSSSSSTQPLQSTQPSPQQQTSSPQILSSSGTTPIGTNTSTISIEQMPTPILSSSNNETILLSPKSNSNSPIIQNSKGILNSKIEIKIKSNKQQMNTNDKTVLHPNFPYIFLRNWPFLSKEEAKGLNITKDLTRALNMFDLIQTTENAKFGILYIKKNQSLESEILKNDHGSPRYFEFLSELGDITSLRDLEGQFTGGLDSNESLVDGEFVLRYEDQVTTIIYHVATMMPNNKHDEQSILKKSHIGNDYVTIIYSENSDRYDIRTISGEFNYVHIIIYPLEIGLNRVEVMARDDLGLPKFGPLMRFQIVSDSALSSLVRLTAIQANIAINSYRKLKGEFVSNWEERLRQIKIIKQRFSKNFPTDPTDELRASIDDFFEN
eukprot:gene1934-1074_t